MASNAATGTFRLRALGAAGGEDGLVARLLRKAKLTLTGASMIVLSIGGWCLARQLGSRVMFLMVYAACLILILAAVVARRRLAVQVTRSKLPLRMRERQTVDVTLTITAKRRATTLVLQEHVHPRLGRKVQLPIASVAPGQEIEHTFTLRPTLRGIYELGPTIATWSDPFGLTSQQQQLTTPVKLIVHPSTEAVSDRVLTRMWEDPPVRPPLSKPWPTGFEFYGMRDYVPGDDIRRVVWSAVAKTGRMLVRESEQGITDRVVIALDTSKEWHKPGEPSDTFETAVRVVASLGARHLKDGFSVTLLTNQARLGEALRGSRARIPMLDELAKVQRSTMPFGDVGVQLIREAKRGAHFVVVTPHVDKEMAGRLRLVLERGASVVVVKIMWDETDPQSIARAATLGCAVVQVPHAVPLSAIFSGAYGAGIRR